MRTLLLIMFLAAMAPRPVQANAIIADLSTYRIAIDAGFQGIRLFIFGARNESGDVVVVIRGPHKRFIVRKKERIAGLWVNRRQLTFPGVPDFYALATAKPLETTASHRLLRALGIGTPSLLAPPEDSHEKALFPEFSDAFLLYQRAHRLYPEPVLLSFMGETLFKTVIPFPDTLPKGDYTAEIYLISDGELAGMQAMPIRVEKSGLDAAIYDMAHRQPLLYGLLAVLLALGAGWSAGKLFERV